MDSDFVVTAQAPRIELDEHGLGRTLFTVTNTGRSDAPVTVSAVPGDGAAASWFTLEQPVGVVNGGASVLVIVTVQVPPGTPAGEYRFAVTAGGQPSGWVSFRYGPAVPTWQIEQFAVDVAPVRLHPGEQTVVTFLISHQGAADDTATFNVVADNAVRPWLSWPQDPVTAGEAEFGQSFRGVTVAVPGDALAGRYSFAVQLRPVQLVPGAATVTYGPVEFVVQTPVEWAVQWSTPNFPLNADGTGDVTATVHNRSATTQRAVLDIRPDERMDPSWFTVEPAVLDVAPGDPGGTFTVRIAVPANTISRGWYGMRATARADREDLHPGSASTGLVQISGRYLTAAVDTGVRIDVEDTWLILPQGQVTARFTVTNSTYIDSLIELGIVPLDGADRAWFTVEPARQTIAGQRSGLFAVTVDAAAAMSSGLFGPGFLGKTSALAAALIPIDGSISPTAYELSEAVLLTTHVHP